MTRRDVLSRVFLWFAALAVILFTGMSVVADDPALSKEKGRGRGVSDKRGQGHAFAKAPDETKNSLFEQWRASRRAQDSRKASDSLRKQIPIGSGALGRASVVINDGNAILFTKVFPGSACDPDPRLSAPNVQAPGWTANTAFAVGTIRRPNPTYRGVLFQVTTAGTSGPTEPVWPTIAGTTVNDGTVVWTGIGFSPTLFTGCNAMQLVHRTQAGTETVIATEGQAIPGRPTQLGGWAEFYDMNNANIAAFKAHEVGVQFLGNVSGPDEAVAALFIAGPTTALTRVAGQGDVIAGRTLCGVGPMMKINEAGQIAYEGFFLSGVGVCGTDDPKGVFRFTPPSTHEFMFGIGSAVPGGGTVTQWGDMGDGDFFGGINALGHSAVSLQLSDGDQAIYLITAAGTVTEVARSGNAGPGGIFDRIGAQTYINDTDQVLFKAAIGGDGNPSTGGEDGVDNLVLFTPGSGNQKVVALTDPVPGGGTYQGFGAFADVNNAGNVVFRAGLVGTTPGVEDLEQAGIFHWTRASNTFNQVIRVGPGTFGLFNDVIGMNNADAVFFGVHNGSQPAGFDDDEEQEGSIRFWTLTGGVQTVVALGQPLDGPAITAIFAQHIPFKRQFNETCSFASLATTGNSPPDEAQENVKQGRLFAVFNTTCGIIGPTPTPTPTGTLLPTSTPTTTPITGAVPVVPTLSLPMMILLGLALAGIAFLVLRKV